MRPLPLSSPRSAERPVSPRGALVHLRLARTLGWSGAKVREQMSDEKNRG